MDFPAWPVDTVAEELIKGPADPSPATVQQDPFVGLADAQNVTCVRGTHPFDIPQQDRRPERLADHYRAPVAGGGCRYWSSQSRTVLHHTRRLRGFSTQCPSSGK